MSQTDAEKLAEGCAASMYERDTAARAQGIEIVEVAPGYSKLSMSVRPGMLNGHAICHGGFIFMLADTAFAYACNSYNRVNVAQNCDIDFLRPAREGDILVAVAKEQRKGKLTGLYDVTISTREDVQIAAFRGRSFQLDEEVIQEGG